MYFKRQWILRALNFLTVCQFHNIPNVLNQWIVKIDAAKKDFITDQVKDILS